MRAKWSLALLATALAATACSAKTEEGANGSSAPSPTTAATATAQPAAELKPVELIWHFPLPAVPADMQTVEDAVNKIVKEKINATVRMKPQTFGDYTQKMNVVVASGEKADILWTSNWNFNYAQNVALGAFLPLDDLLQTYAPDVVKSLPAFVWNATKVKGKTYGVPNYQTITNREGYKVVKEYADKYGFDAAKIKTFEDIEPFLEAVKKAEPNKIPIIFARGGKFTTAARTYGFELFNNIGAVRIDKEPGKVVNVYETEEYSKHLDLVRNWYLKGYINEDAATVKNAADVMKTGNVVSDFHNVLSADTVANEKSRMGDIVLAPTTDYFASTGSIITTMQAISRTSANPERAMMFINLINTDKELYNLLAYGVEGKHYAKVSDQIIEVKPDAGYNHNAAWVLGNTFNALLTPAKDAKTVEQVRKDNESAKPSPLMGFSFDTAPVAAEIAALNTVLDQYGPGLNTGTTDPKEKLPEFLEKLKQAGVDKVVAELQKQLDEWNKTK